MKLAYRIVRSKKFRKLYTKFVYTKLCYSRLGSYLTIPKDIIDDVVRYGTFLAVLGYTKLYWLIPIGILYITLKMVIGHIDYKLKLPQLETSVSNSFNPEISRIHKEVKKIGKRNKNN